MLHNFSGVQWITNRKLLSVCNTMIMILFSLMSTSRPTVWSQSDTKFICENELIWTRFAAGVSEWSKDYVAKFLTASNVKIDLLAREMQTGLSRTLDTHVPSNKSTVRCNKSWFNNQTKSITSQVQSAHESMALQRETQLEAISTPQKRGPKGMQTSIQPAHFRPCQ